MYVYIHIHIHVIYTERERERAKKRDITLAVQPRLSLAQTLAALQTAVLNNQAENCVIQALCCCPLPPPAV